MFIPDGIYEHLLISDFRCEMICNLLIITIILMIFFSIKQISKYKKLKLDNMILEKQVNEIRNNFSIYRSVSDCQNSELKNLRTKNTELTLENMKLKNIIESYRNELYGNYYKSAYYVRPILKDTVDAIRYAMKHAHPDNGGNEEDFIKFKKVYEEIKNKQEGVTC